MFRTYLIASGAALAASLAAPAALAQATNNFFLINDMFTQNRNKEVETLSDAGRWAKILVGTALSEGRLTADDALYLDILSEQFDYLTPENSGKWGSLQDEDPNVWDFALHDQVVDFATNNDIIYKGHTLVWHSQAPSYLDDGLTAAELQDAIDSNITENVSRYQGDIYAWDVVNEAIGDDAQFRDSVFYTTLGEDYIADAFFAADAIDPKALLYYNDYNIAGINAKSNAVYDLVAGLVADGVPIDGVGFQMHLTATGAPDYDELVANLQRFADLGLRVNISELDVRIADLPWDQATNFAIQRQVYHRVAAACVAVANCDSLTTWGFTDAYSWIDSTFAPDDPLQYDESYMKKPAWYGLVDGLVGVAPEALGTAPNLVANSQFESGMDGWVGIASDTYRLWRRHTAYEGLSMLYVDDRQGPESGAAYGLLGVVSGARDYQASAIVQIRNRNEAPVNLDIYYQCDDGAEGVLNVATATFYRREWAEISGEVTLPSCEFSAVELRLSGPIAPVDMLIDAVALRPLTLVPDTEGLGENIVLNSDFETSSDWWFGFGDAQVAVTAQRANSGAQSGLANNRTASWQGPATSLLDNAVPGADYQVLSFVSVSAGTGSINATVQAQCVDEDPQYLYIGNASATDSAFALLSGSFTAPDCELTTLTLYFEGPAAETDILVDDVYVREILGPEPGDNLLPNGDFENGVAGWVAWGDSVLQASSTYAQSGVRSALLTNRTATYQGPVVNVLPLVVPGETYEVSAWGRVEGVASDQMNITLRVTCDGADDYLQLDSQTVNDAEWTSLSGSVAIPSCDLTAADLYFDGPAAGVDTYVDNVVLTGTPAIGGNLVTNPGFESGLDGWVVWGGTLEVSSDAYTGTQSALHTARDADWQGPVWNLLSVAQPGGSYSISGYAKLDGGTGDVGITVKTTCDDGTEDYGFAGANTVADEWTQVSGNITLPACVLTEVSVYFSNVAAGIDLYLDEVSITAN